MRFVAGLTCYSTNSIIHFPPEIASGMLTYFFMYIFEYLSSTGTPQGAKLLSGMCSVLEAEQASRWCMPISKWQRPSPSFETIPSRG